MKNFTYGLMIGLLLALAGSSAFFYARQKTASEAVLEQKVDTIYLYRQKAIREPKIAQKTMLHEFVLLTVPMDSTRMRILRDSLASERGRCDSLQILLEREQKRYTDDSTYTAWVSGIDPRLDSIKFRIPERIITRTDTKRVKSKFNVGLQAGFGVVVPISGQVNAGGYVGLGVQYNFL